MAGAVDLPDLRGKLRLDLSELRTMPARVRAAIREAQAAASGDGIKLRIEADDKGTAAEVRRTERVAQAEASANPVKIPVELDRENLERLAQHIRDLRTVFSAAVAPALRFARTTALVAEAAGGVSAALVGAVGLVGQTFALAGALAEAAGAAPLLASGLASVGVIAGTAVVATMGVSDALKLVSKETATLAAGQKLTQAQTDKLNAALKGLAPSARGFVLEIAKLLPTLRGIQQAVQQRFFAGLATDVRALAERYLPLLRRTGVEVAEVLNGVLRRAVRDLNTEVTRSRLATIFQTARSVLASFGPSLSRIPGVLIQIASAASPILAQLARLAAGALGQLLDKIDSTLSTLSGRIRFAEAIQRGVEVLADLGRVAIGVAGVIKGISDAARQVFGTDLPGVIAGVLGQLSAFVRSAGGQNVFVSLFSAAKPVIQQIGTLVRELAPLLAGLFPVISNLATAFLSGLQPVLPVLAGLLGAVGRALALLLPGLSAAAQILGGALTEAVNALAPVLPLVADAFAELVGALAPSLPVIAQALADALVQLAPSLPIVAQAFTDLAIALAPSLPELARTLSDALTALAPYLPGLAQSLGDLASAMVRLIQAVVPYLPAFVAFVAAAIRLASIQWGALAGLVSAVSGALSSIGGALTSLSLPLQGIITKFLGLNSVLLIVAVQGIAGFIGNISTLPGRAAAAVSSLASRVAGAVSAVVTVLSRIASSAVSGAIGPLSSLPSRAVAAVVSTVARVSGVIAPIVGAVARIASSAVSSIGSVLSRMPGVGAASVAGTIGRVAGVLSGMPNRVAGIAASAVSRFIGALSAIVGRAAAAVAGVPGAITSALAGAASAAFSAGARIPGAIAQGILSNLSVIRSAISIAAGIITGHLPGSPVRYGPLRVLNRGYAGRQISAMIASGMVAETRRVLAAATALVAAARPAGAPYAGGRTAAQTGATRLVTSGSDSTMRLHPDDLMALARALSVRVNIDGRDLNHTVDRDLGQLAGLLERI